MRTVITGGAGFIGSHLCERFVGDGDEVICVDNLLTGNRRNIAQLVDNAVVPIRRTQHQRAGRD